MILNPAQNKSIINPAEEGRLNKERFYSSHITFGNNYESSNKKDEQELLKQQEDDQKVEASRIAEGIVNRDAFYKSNITFNDYSFDFKDDSRGGESLQRQQQQQQQQQQQSPSPTTSMMQPFDIILQKGYQTSSPSTATKPRNSKHSPSKSNCSGNLNHKVLHKVPKCNESSRSITPVIKPVVETIPELLFTCNDKLSESSLSNIGYESPVKNPLNNNNNNNKSIFGFLTVPDIPATPEESIKRLKAASIIQCFVRRCYVFWAVKLRRQYHMACLIQRFMKKFKDVLIGPDFWNWYMIKRMENYKSERVNNPSYLAKVNSDFYFSDEVNRIIEDFVCCESRFFSARMLILLLKGL